MPEKSPSEDYDWNSSKIIYEAEDVIIYAIIRKSDKLRVALKKTRFYIANNSEKLRKEIEWLSDINTLIKTKKHRETLNIFDYFRHEYFIYSATELCICDL